MYSTMTNSDGRTTAVIDYSAMSTSGLGNLISGVAARLRDADIDDLEFTQVSIADIFSPSRRNGSLSKFSTMALAMINEKSAAMTDLVEVASTKGIKVIRDSSGDGFKSIKNKMMELS